MRDFLGQQLQEGDFIVYPGAGNAKAEYGMILMRILAVKKDAISCERLTVRYNRRPDADPNDMEESAFFAEVGRSKSTIKSPTKVVKVNPPQKMMKLFNNPEQDAKRVGKWIHGATSLEW